VTYLLATGQGPALFLCFWLLFGYAGVVLIPLSWLLRHTVERVEFDNERYRHHHVNLSWWFPKDWSTGEITQIDFGHYDDESITTLNVRRGSKRDMIAYWANDDFREFLFEKIRTHLAEIDAGIPLVEMNTGSTAG